MRLPALTNDAVGATTADGGSTGPEGGKQVSSEEEIPSEVKDDGIRLPALASDAVGAATADGGSTGPAAASVKEGIDDIIPKEEESMSSALECEEQVSGEKEIPLEVEDEGRMPLEAEDEGRIPLEAKDDDNSSTPTGNAADVTTADGGPTGSTASVEDGFDKIIPKEESISSGKEGGEQVSGEEEILLEVEDEGRVPLEAKDDDSSSTPTGNAAGATAADGGLTGSAASVEDEIDKINPKEESMSSTKEGGEQVSGEEKRPVEATDDGSSSTHTGMPLAPQRLMVALLILLLVFPRLTS
ncbi:hypothetical protein V8F20_007588 [Naviculisporaceae sp. PSN 640]